MKMIPKRYAPHLNRKQRRHPDKATPVLKGGVPDLMYRLLAWGGYVQAHPVFPDPQGEALTLPYKPEPSGMLASIKDAGKRITGAVKNLFSRAKQAVMA